MQDAPCRHRSDFCVGLNDAKARPASPLAPLDKEFHYQYTLCEYFETSALFDALIITCLEQKWRPKTRLELELS